jgi:hypothetical protein
MSNTVEVSCYIFGMTVLNHLTVKALMIQCESECVALAICSFQLHTRLVSQSH